MGPQQCLGTVLGPKTLTGETCPRAGGQLITKGQSLKQSIFSGLEDTLKQKERFLGHSIPEDEGWAKLMSSSAVMLFGHRWK